MIMYIFTHTYTQYTYTHTYSELQKTLLRHLMEFLRINVKVPCEA